MDLFDTNIEINSAFQRSARIDSKIQDGFIENYIFHNTSRSILNRIALSYSESNQGSFTLTGPYGTGKSSLALFLNALVHNDKKIKNLASERAKLTKKDQFNKVFLEKGKWFSITIIGGKLNSNDLIASSIDQAVAESWIDKKIPPSLKIKTKPQTEHIIKKLNRIVIELNKKNFGLLLVIDEMGRLLEFASNTGGDLNLFQEIAENFSNNKLENIGHNLFLGILHQPFEEYASSLGRTVQEDWQKIQGRFEDIPFSIGADESIFLIAKAIKKKNKISEISDKKIKRVTKSIIRTIQRSKVSNDENSLEDSLINCFPLNPLVSLLLGPISRNRFGQNERSIFTFLNSGEPHGLIHFLRNNNTDKGTLYGLDNLFDYLQSNFEPSILVSPIGHQWSEAADAVRRSESSDNHQVVKLSKAIAMIDLFGKGLSIFASKDILYDVLPDTKSEIDEYLGQLEEKKIIIFRKFKKAYVLFSGSDINLDEIVEQNKAQIKDDHAIILSQIPEIAPVIAKRHLHQTGALRLFQRHCLFLKSVKVAAEQIESLNNSDISTGSVILLLKDSKDSEAEFQAKIKEIRSISFTKPAILGFSNESNSILIYALELASLTRARTSVTSLESDPVARKEMQARIGAAQNLLLNHLDANFENAEWSFKKKVHSKENLTTITSEVSNSIYYNTPIIVNELVNREKLSSSSTSGLVSLVKRMINNANEENLGLEGAPIEFGIYLSVVHANKLHGKKNGNYSFQNPSKSQKGFYEVFEFIKNFLKEKNHPVKLTEIYTELRKAPFGIKAGILPLILISFFKSNEEHYALYENYNQQGDTFLTEFSHQTVDRIFQIPDDIKIMHVKISGAKVELLEEFKNYIIKELKVSVGSDVTPLSILKPIVVQAHKMSGWARKTRMFDDKRVVMLRDELLSSRNPYQLLYNRLPEICLSKTIDAEGIKTNEIKNFIKEFDKLWSELKNAHKQLIEEFKNTILKVFKSDPNIFDISFETIKKRALLVGENDPFSAKIKKYKSDDEWIEQVVGYSIGKPVEEWMDQDFTLAQLKLEDMVRHFIMTDRLLTLRNQHKDSKIVDLAVYEGKVPQRSSKFYFSEGPKSNVIDDSVKEINKILEDKKLSESEKGEIALKLLQNLMSEKKENKDTNPKKEPA